MLPAALEHQSCSRRCLGAGCGPHHTAAPAQGDTCNLLGALLKGDQLPTVVFTAQYFICMDVVLLVQYVYYTTLQRQRERSAAARRHRHAHRHHRHSHRHRHHLLQPRLADGGLLEGGGSAGEAQQQQGQPPDRGAGEAAAGSVEAGVVTRTAADAPLLVGSGTSAANGREFVFRPQRALACVGLLLLFGRLQPQPAQHAGGLLQQQQQPQLLERGAHEPQGAALGGWRRRLAMVGSASAEVLAKRPAWSQ